MNYFDSTVDEYWKFHTERISKMSAIDILNEYRALCEIVEIEHLNDFIFVDDVVVLIDIIRAYIVSLFDDIQSISILDTLRINKRR